MSGIFGALSLDGGEQAPARIEPMAALLARRGPDGTRLWHEGGAALGQALLATTPEALVEKLPLTDPDSGCTITADVRLDNREALMAALGLEGETRVVGDGELILRAYLRWGEDCPQHLLGDFAFAIWDARAEHLFCARDHMGMRQLLYHHDPGRRFVFATEARAVLAHPGVPRRINRGRVADVILNLEGLDLTSTLYDDLFRLPPAHCLTVGATSFARRRYWQLPSVAPIELPSDQAYADALLEHLTEAVRCRLRTARPPGAMLSGGIDSGSIAVLAARLLAKSGAPPLQCFSAVGPDSETCIETRSARASAALPHLQPTFIESSNLTDQIEELAQLIESCEPFDTHMGLIGAVYLTARRAGVDVMLDGVSGDIVLTAGNVAASALRHGRVGTALREIHGLASFYGQQARPWRTLAKSAFAAFAPSPWRAALRDWRLRRETIDQRLVASLPEGVNVGERRRRMLRHLRGERPFGPDYRRLAILHPNVTVARERYDRLAGELGIEPRNPFLDIRLVAFCLSLPEQQLQRNGWPKLVLRNAMAGFLPEEVLWRRGKEHLGPQFTEALARRLLTCCPANQVDMERRFKLTLLSSWLRRNQPCAESLGRQETSYVRDCCE